MMLRSFRLIFGVFLLLGFTTCSNPPSEFDVFLDVEGDQWAYSDLKEIPWNCADTTSSYDIFLNIRHQGNYEWQNIYLKVRVIDPEGKERVYLKSVALSDAEGYWVGKGLGDWKVASPLLLPRMQFKKLGLYRMRLEQHMRVDPLEGVGQVGLKMVKRPTQSKN